MGAPPPLHSAQNLRSPHARVRPTPIGRRCGRLQRARVLQLRPDANPWRLTRTYESYTDRNAQTVRHSGPITAARFSPLGDVVASADREGALIFWAHPSGVICDGCHVRRAHAGAIYALDFTPAADVLATGGADGRVRLWANGAHNRALPLGSLDVRSCAATSDIGAASPFIGRGGRLSAVCVGAEGSGGVSALRFSRDGRFLAVALAHTIKLWQHAGRRAAGASQNAHGWTLVRTVRDQLRFGTVALCMAWSPDSSQLAIGASDGTLKLWALPGTGEDGSVFADVWSGGAQPRAHLAAVFDVAFSPDGTQLVSASADGTVKLWGAADGKALAAERAPSRPEGVGEPYSYSPTASPSVRPSLAPSPSPRTEVPSVSPTRVPTPAPATRVPTAMPVTALPSAGAAPKASSEPTLAPTLAPTRRPSAAPTLSPTTATAAPSTPSPSVPEDVEVQTARPSALPSFALTEEPTVYLRPTGVPSVIPSPAPTFVPTDPAPPATLHPTLLPSASPTAIPTFSPLNILAPVLTGEPSWAATDVPTLRPSLRPSSTPSAAPSERPTSTPTLLPQTQPPTSAPSRTPR